MRLTAVILLALSVGPIGAQGFTKVTSGQQSNDGGDSRSVNWIDYDQDGDLDLYVSNGPSGGQNNLFYRNEAGNAFSRLDSLAITLDGSSSVGCSWADYDNDGDPDLFVSTWYNQHNLIYRNEGADSFSLISGSPIYGDLGYSETGSWGDYDNDGHLDLYVANSYGTPRRNFLYHNSGDGTFAKVTAGAIATDNRYSRNVSWADYNGDGFADVFVPNENGQNDNLYRNNGDGTFTAITAGDIVNDGASGFGSSWGDYDNDGDLDLFVANFSNENNFLYANNGDGTFAKVADGPVANSGGWSVGSDWGDIDNDGDLDLFVANGFASVPSVNNHLYINDGLGVFTQDTMSAVTRDGGWSYGCSFGDCNNDGWLDLFVAKCAGGNENNALFRNQGGSNNWLKVNLQGVSSNRSAIGAVAKAKAVIGGGGRWQMRQVSGQSGYCGQNLQLHFGLGEAGDVDTLLIVWPSGINQYLTNLAVNQTMTVIEDTSLSGVNSTGDRGGKPASRALAYPNPCRDKFVVALNGTNGQDGEMELYSVDGRQMRKCKQSSCRQEERTVYEFATRGLPNGIYIARITSGRRSENVKLVIAR